MNSAIVHPHLMREIRLHFNSLVTIETLTNTQNTQSGQNVRSYVADPLHTAIKCYIEPVSPSTEVRRADQSLVEYAYKIALTGWYPDLKVTDHARTDDNKIHDILSVDTDDTHTVTFLTTEIING